jgi:hypothetical protein
MGVELLHYRVWEGRFRHPLWSAWPVARTSLRMLLRRKLFWALYAAALLIFLMFFFGGYLLSWAETQIPSGPIQWGRFQAEPDRLVRSLRQGLRVLNGSQDTFAYFFLYQGAMVMVVLALAGSVLVGGDFLHGSLPFYLAKPLSRWHYVLGKCLAVGVVVNLLTTVPALLLYAQHALDDWDYFTDPDFFLRTGTGEGPAGVPLLLGVLGYGLVLTVCLSLVLVAAASWARRTMPLVLVWTTVFLFFRLLAAVLVDGLRYGARWRLMDLWNDLRLVGCALLQVGHERISPQPQPGTGEAALVLGGVCLLCLSYLSLRTRAVEVVR